MRRQRAPVGVTFVASLAFGRGRTGMVKVGLVVSNVLSTAFLLVMLSALAWTGAFGGVDCGA